MVFGSGGPQQFVWVCGGQPLQVVDSGKYLGVQLGSASGVGHTCSLQYQKMFAAWALLRRQFAGLGCASSVGLMLHLFQACVPPVASYACEVWGHCRLPPALKADRTRLVQSYHQILRQILGLRRTTPAAILHAEAGLGPLEHMWWVRRVRFWNALVSLPAGSLHRAVLLDSCRDAVVRNVRNWAHGFMVGLRELGYAFTIRCDALEIVDLPRVRQLLAQPTERVWQELHVCPRTCPSGRRGALHVPALVCAAAVGSCEGAACGTPSDCGRSAAGVPEVPRRLPRPSQRCWAPQRRAQAAAHLRRMRRLWHLR
jgi:hypothetical protein